MMEEIILTMMMEENIQTRMLMIDREAVAA